MKRCTQKKMKNKKPPMRRCIGCMESKPKEELIRIAWYEGRLSLDPTGKAKGRGMYICRNQDCLQKAVKKGAFARSLHENPGSDQIEQVAGQLEAEINGQHQEGDDHAE